MNKVIQLIVIFATYNYGPTMNATPLPPVLLHVNRALSEGGSCGEKKHTRVSFHFSILTASKCCSASQMLLLSQPFCVVWYILSG